MSAHRMVGRSARRFLGVIPVSVGSLVSVWSLVAVSVVVLDQATKTLARLLLPLCLTPCYEVNRVLGPIGVVRVDNAGSAVGFGQGFDLWTLLAVLGFVGAPLLARRSTDSAMLLGAALLAGGGLGNLVDRMMFGAVTDFIALGASLAINVADVALATGAVLMTRSLQRRASLPSRRTPAPRDPVETTEGGIP